MAQGSAGGAGVGVTGPGPGPEQHARFVPVLVGQQSPSIPSAAQAGLTEHAAPGWSQQLSHCPVLVGQQSPLSPREEQEPPQVSGAGAGVGGAGGGVGAAGPQHLSQRSFVVSVDMQEKPLAASGFQQGAHCPVLGWPTQA